jgi:hypothetical protein
MAMVAVSVLAAGPAAAQSPADSAAVRQAALDYIEGWYAGDAARMERAVHPRLAKRIVGGSAGEPRLDEMGAAELVRATGSGAGRGTPPERQRREVEVLSLDPGMASVRVRSERFVDHMHLARWRGEWKIVNVLWNFLPPTR